MVDLNPLPPGITVTYGLPPGGWKTDLDEFEAACVAASQAVSGSVVRKPELDSGPLSYVAAELSIPASNGKDRRVWVYCNKAYPIIAFKDTAYVIPWGATKKALFPNKFVSDPELSKAFRSRGFDAVPISLLTAPPSILSLDSLSPEEREETVYSIDYWGSKNVGEVLFNKWD